MDLSFIASVIIDMVGILTCLWIFFMFFGIDAIEYTLEKFNKKSNLKKYDFKETFLYAFVFSVLATTAYDLVRDYINIDRNSLGIYFLLQGTLILITMFFVWRKYKEKSIPDMLVSLIATIGLVVIIKWLHADLENYYPEAFLLSFTLMYWAFKKHGNIKTNELPFFIYAFSFTASIFLLNMFLFPVQSDTSNTIESCIYFIIIIISFIFYISSIKNRDFIKKGFSPIILGGIISMLSMELIKYIAFKVTT